MATGTRRMDAANAKPSVGETAKAWAASAQPAPSVPPTKRAALACMPAAIVSGVLLWACFQPLSLGSYIGWFALVPFLLLVRAQARPRYLYSWAWVCGAFFFTPALQWMRVADDMMFLAWFALSIYCALFFVAALFCIRRLERWNVPLVVSVPLVWVAIEYVRCWLLTGFPWYLLAHTQHDVLPMIQIADLGGVFIVSLVVVAVNAFIFDCIWQFPEVKQWFGQSELESHRYYASWDVLNRSFFADWLFRRNLLLEGGVLAIVLLCTYGYGVVRMGQDRFRAGPTVCLLQSNLDQRLRDSTSAPKGDGDAAQTVTEHFGALCKRASHGHIPPPDLLIWPETSFPASWYQVSPKLPNEHVPPDWRDADIEMREKFRQLVVNHTHIPHLIGINSNDLDVYDGKYRIRRHNSALFINARGQVDGRFDKIHRVPFGEYIPFKDWLPFMNVFSVYDYDFSVQQGEKYTRFPLGKFHFGVLICYEDSDPFMARRYVTDSDEGPGVDFLVNISNDGWFDGSYEHEEHLAVSRFRAIECRKAMVRAVNMGVSAVIDSNGRVLKPTPYPNTSPTVWTLEPDESGRIPDFAVSDWHKMKKTTGILKATIPLDDRFSFYVLLGDWLPIACWTALLGSAAWAYWRRRKLQIADRKSQIAKPGGSSI